jgi:DHA1 family bicyclomycin/chloramphenicol resistance-like MFS transporter
MNIKTPQRAVSVLSCLMVTLSQAGISLYLPSLPAMQQDFHTTHQAIALSLTAYLAGYALLMLFWGALSDALGRKHSLYIAVLTFAIASCLLAVIHSIAVFDVLRFFQGAGGGGCAIIGRTAIRDVFEKAALVKAMSRVSIAFCITLGIGQAIGGEVQHFLHWRYDFLLMALLGFSAFIAVVIFLPETFTPTTHIIYNPRKILKNYLLILRDKYFLFAAIGGGVGYGISVAFNTISPFLFQNTLRLTPNQYGYLGFLIAFSYLTGAFVTNRYIHKLGMTKLIRLGVGMIIFFGLAMLIPAVLHIVTIAAILPPMLILTAGQALIYPCAMTLALKHYKHQAGYATALFGFIQQTLCCLIGGIAAYTPHQTQLPLTLIIIAIGIIAFLFLARVTDTLATSR